MFRFGLKGRLGAAHAIELPFVFDALDRTDGEVGEFLFAEEPPEELATTVHGAWSSFVKTGSPQHPSLPEWPAYDPTRRATMEFDVEPRLVDDPDAEERKLWDGVEY
jgi:carboxylesterase type B